MARLKPITNRALPVPYTGEWVYAGLRAQLQDVDMSEWGRVISIQREGEFLEIIGENGYIVWRGRGTPE